MPETISEAIPTECMQVLLHVWDYLDDQLTPDETSALRAHIAECPQCYDYQLFQESFLEALATLRARRGAPWQLRARVLESLLDAGYAPGRG
jgi:anti-sigma factor (TIGR02949 family)